MSQSAARPLLDPALLDTLQALQPVVARGRVVQAFGTTLRVSGLRAHIGQQCLIRDPARPQAAPLRAEVVGLREHEAILLPLGHLQGVSMGAEVEIIDGGTCGMEMLEQLENLDGLVVVDCVRANQPPATPILLKGDDVPVFFKTKLSPHQVSLSDVLASLEFTDRAPKAIAIVGMQPVSMSLGMELSPEVAAQVPQLVAMTLTELAALGIRAEARG